MLAARMARQAVAVDFFVWSCYKLCMALFDLPLEQLREYRPERARTDRLRRVLETTLAEAAGHDLDVRVRAVRAGLVTVDVFDVTFAGFGGHPISGWLLSPRGAEGPLPCVVEYIGYCGGRGLAHERADLVPAAGYAHLVMDTRGQGCGNWRRATPATPTAPADATQRRA